MFKTLLKARLAQMTARFRRSGRNKKRGAAGLILIGLFVLYIIGCFVILFFGIFATIAEPFARAGLSWLYFAMYAMFDVGLMVLGSVFMAKSELYEARDNELLLAMPIPPRLILSSRLATLFVLNCVYGLFVTAPAAAAWITASGVGFTGVQLICFVIIALLMPVFALTLSCVLAWLMSALTSRLRHKNIVDTIFMLAFFVVYFYVCFSMNSVLATLAASGENLAQSLGGVTPLVWLGRAVAEGNLAMLGLAAAVVLVPFALVAWLLSVTYIRLAAEKRGGARIKYVERAEKAQSLSSALFKKEMSRFTSSSAYMVNGGMGALMIVIAAVYFFIKGNPFASIIPGFDGTGFFVPMFTLVICLMLSMCTISAASISIERQTIWILHSLPVPAPEALKAKTKVQLVITLPPTVLAIAAVIYTFRPTGLMLALSIVIPLAFAVFFALVGIFENIRHRNFHWTTEAQAVKNGAAIYLSLFIGWGVCIVPIVLLFITNLKAETVMAAFAVILIALCAALYRWVLGRGAKRFTEMIW